MLPLIIFILTLFGILFRPFKLKIWVFSSLGAVAVIALKLVDLKDLAFVFLLIWDSSLTLIALIVISLCLQNLGFFEWLIFYTLKLCQRLSSPKSSINSALNLENSHLNSAILSSNSINLNSAKKAELSNNENSKNQISHLNSINSALNSTRAEFLARTNSQEEILPTNSALNSKNSPLNSILNSPTNNAISTPTKLFINSKILFLSLCILAFFCSTVLANDGAILILTPLVLGLFLRAKSTTSSQLMCFLFAIAFLCDTSSNALIISNLSNIITANYFKLDFTDFALTMLLPNLLGFIIALILFLLIFRKDLKRQTAFKIPLKPKLKTKFFALYLTLLMLFVASFFVSRHFKLPLSINCLAFATLLLCLLWVKSPKKAFNSLKNAPFGIIIFSFTLFVVVLALTKLDFQTYANAFFSTVLQDEFIAIFSIGTASALGASIFNNLPMVLFGDLILNDFFANVENLGVLMNLNGLLNETNEALNMINSLNSSEFASSAFFLNSSEFLNTVNYLNSNEFERLSSTATMISEFSSSNALNLNELSSLENATNSSLQALKSDLIYAHLLGCNIGSKLTPIGSLCTLLWLGLLAKKGVRFSLKSYLKLSLIFTLPVLFVALLPLCLS